MVSKRIWILRIAPGGGWGGGGGEKGIGVHGGGAQKEQGETWLLA
jgi:hypothetical protein